MFEIAGFLSLAISLLELMEENVCLIFTVQLTSGIISTPKKTNTTYFRQRQGICNPDPVAPADLPKESRNKHA